MSTFGQIKKKGKRCKVIFEFLKSTFISYMVYIHSSNIYGYVDYKNHVKQKEGNTIFTWITKSSACLVFVINNCEESSPTINNFHPTRAHTSIPCRNQTLSVIHSFMFS
jgi:hypothetical protein